MRNKLHIVGNNPRTMMDWESRAELKASGVKNRPSTPIKGVVHCSVLNTEEHRKKEQDIEEIHHKNLALNMNKTLKRPRETR